MIKNHFSKLAKFILNKKKGLTVFICVLVCVVPCALLLKSHKPLFNPYLTKAPSNSNYLYQNTKNPFKVYLGSRQDEKKPTARFEVGENKFVEFEAENLNAKDAKLEANKVWRYENVRDNTDLTYRLMEKGLKEEIILNKPIGPISQISPVSPDSEETTKSFSFLLSYPKEMEIKERTPNELAFYEKDGPYLFHFQKPFMQDAKGEKSEEIKIKVVRAKPSIPTPGVDKETPGVEDNQLTYRLTFVPDQNWLNDSNRKYPVVIDPTIIHDTPSEFDDGTFNRTTDSGSGSQTSKLESSFEELPADINTVGLWHMNETSGSSVADSSGNSNTGTATGTTIVDGKFGKARSFNGSSDYIDLGAPASLNINPPLTVEMWIKRDTNDTDGGWLFLGNNNTDSGTKNGLVLASNFKIYADQYPGSGTSTIGSTIIGTNQWYHIAAIFDTSQTYVYVNGQLDGQAAAETYTGVTPTKWLIGTRLYPTNSVYYFNGLIDEVRINNVALSPEEIKAHANRRPYGIYTSPVIDFGQTPASLNALNWVDNITPPDLPSGWTKVKPVLIDNTQNSSALTNHQVKIHVDYDSNMQSDFDDLKFTNSSGTNLDYWIESKSDGVEATVWVEVDSIPASSWTTIFMFYENSGASAASNIANTFVYGQAFTAANGTDITTFSGWSKDVDNSSTYTIDTNRLKMYHPGAAPNEARDGTWYTFGTQLDTNNMVEYKITVADSDSWDYMGEVTDTTWANMGSNVSSKTAINNETWYAYTASAWPTIQSGLTINNTYKFSIRVNSSSQGLYYIDDVYKAVYACQTSCSNIKNLVFGNYGYATGNDTWYIDDLRVRQYTSPEPAASVGASVEFETRTSADNSTWEAWKPTTNETAIASMDSDASNWSSLPAADFTQSWKKYDNSIPAPSNGSSTNGRIPLGTDTKGDDAQAYEPAVLLDDGTYKMWYAGHDGTNVRLYYATSPDGLTWTKVNNVTATNCDSGGPCEGNGKVGLGSSGRGDDYHTYKASVIKDGSTYKMWYTGYAGADDPHWRIYYATSPDGLTWTKYDNTVPDPSNTTGTNGRIPLGTSGGDSVHVLAPTVIKDGGTYKMWYEGVDGVSSINRIYYATSPDGLTWTKYDNSIPSASDTTGTNGRIPIGTNGAADDTYTERPAVIKDGSLYKMWYVAHDGTNVRIAYAYSTDGLTWTKYDNSIPSASDGSSTNGRVSLGTGTKGDITHSHAPTVVKSGNTYKMWYMGYNANWLIYHATMDLVTLPTAKADESTIKMEGTGSLKTTIGAPQVDSNTVGLWHMEETNGDTNNACGTSSDICDETTNNNDGQLTGTTVTNGFFGKARSFNGTSDYIATGVTGLNSSTFSAEAWIKVPSNPSGGNRYLNYGTSGSNYGGWIMGINTNGTIRSYLDSGCNATWSELTSTISVADNKWHHTVLTYDGTYRRLYIDGVLNISGTYGYCASPSSAVLHIGKATYGSAEYFTGQMDEVRISNVARTAEEIAEAYRAGRDHRIERTLSSTDLSSKNKIPFYVASDRPGTNLEAYVGETTNSVYGADSNTVGLWHLEEKSESWGDTFVGSTIDTTKWVEIDPNANKISQSTGLVLSAGTVAAWDSGVISKANFTRQTANQLYAKFTTSSGVAAPNHMMIGWGQDQTAQPSHTYITHALYFNAGTFYVYQDGAQYGGPYGSGYTTSTAYEVLITLASNGTAKYEVKGGAYTNWTTLLAADNPKTNTPLRAQVAQYQHTGTFNEIRVYPSVFVKDSSTSANNGTTYGTGFTQGKIGKGRNFNGNGDYINAPLNGLTDSTSTITIEFWANVSSSTADNGVISAVPDDVANRLNIHFPWKSSGIIYWDFGNISTTGRLSTTFNSSWYDTWAHWAFVSESGVGQKIYRNGVLIASDVDTSTFTKGAKTLDIGVLRLGPYWWKGLLDEVRISNTARTATEIQQAYQYGLRTHPITTDFVTNPQATYASGTSITINNPWGTTNLTDTLSVGDTIIIRQNENGTEYISQAEVTAITNTSAVYGTVTLAAAFSSIPPSGFTTNAKVFKWQREYWDLKDISPEDRGVTGGITKLGVRVLDGSQGFTFWLDDFRSNSNYLYLPFGNTITSTANRYFQYRAIITGTDGPPSSPNTQNTPTPQISRVTVNYTLSSSGDEKDGRPVAQWKFDEGYGTTAYDETINNHDAVLNNMESTDWVAGYQGKALNLGGTDEYLSVANSADVNFGDHSMSISAFVNTTSSGGTYTLLDKYNSYKGYNLYINASGNVIFQIGDGSNTPSVTGTKAVNDGKWHSILAVRTKGSTLKVYVDGVYDNQASDTADNIDSTVDVSIGRDSSAANYYIGKLDDLNLYDYALSAPQAKVVYNKGYSAVLGATEDVNKGGSGPVGFWKFDEASGQYANDSSGQGNQGTLGANASSGSDDPTWTTSGKIGNALSFDGGDYVLVPSNANLEAGTNFTVESWFTNTDTDANAERYLAGKYNTSSNAWLLGKRVGASGDFGFNVRAGGANVAAIISAQQYNDGNWHHAAGVKSGTTLYLYVDGVQVATSSDAGLTSTSGSANVYIGSHVTTDTWAWKGSIDHTKIYNYSRSVAQIHADMAGSPVAYWKFDESYGTTAYDETTNNNDGTLTDFPTSGAWVNGKFGKALNFDGNNDYVVTGESTSLDISGTTGTTQTAWVKLDSLPSGSPYAITMTTETGQGSETWDKGIRITTGGKATFYVYDGAKKEAVGNTTLQTGVWYHLTGLYDGTNVKIYVNGQDDGGSTTASSTYNFTTPQLVMSFYNETVYFDGQIDEVKIYNYSLTADEIKVEYNQNSAVRLGNTLDVNAGGSGPLGWWKFDEGSGQTIHNLGSAQDLNPSYLGGDSGSDNMDPSWTTNGKIGNALQFDGSGDSPYNDRVTINDTSSANSAALDITENLSVSLWFYADNSNAPNSYWYDIARTTQTECNQYWADVGPQEFTTQDTWGGSMYDWWCGAWDQTNNNWTYYGGSYDQCTYNLTTHYHYAHIGCGAQGIRPRLLEKGHSYRLKYASGSVYGYINKEEVSSVVSSGAWHHVELTYDKSYIRLYIDGNLKTSSPYSESIKYVNSISSQIILKEPLEVGYGFTGKIDDVRIYNYARSQKQVDMDYNGGKPTAHWKLDEATGTTAYDESDNNNDGILTNMEDADHVNGKIGRALEFDGVDEYVNAGTGSSLMPSALTLSAWVKPGGSASGSYETIISKWDTVAGVNHRSYMLSIYDMSTFRFMISSNGQDPPGGNVCDSTTDLVAGVWYHVVATFDGSTLKIYVNGILENQKSQSGIYSSSDPTGIGATMGRTADAKAHYLDGLIDEVKLYNYARTADEVKLDYNNGAVSFK